MASSKRPAAPAPPLTLTTPLLPHENISNQHDTTPKQDKLIEAKERTTSQALNPKAKKKAEAKREIHKNITNEKQVNIKELVMI